tara:strand:- start:668 stop:937 length:270 start_codon:yes stop_codon:yes gene_type:complete
MPRYRYVCEVCDNDQVAFHLYDESPLINCNECDSIEPLVKSITTPSYITKKTGPVKVGDITREYIEKNREILEEEKLKAKEEEYGNDPT